ncbi:MAG: glycosyltransferase family 9 protein [Candidatus Omnitrophota bacterium]
MIYRKILIVNTFGIGDVLFTTPLIQNIKEQSPDVILGYIANARTAPILKHHPLINHVYIYERDEFYEVYRRSRRAFLKKSFDFIRDIKACGYDLVIDLSLNMSTGLLMKLAGVAKRVGFDYKGRGRFLTDKIPLKGYEGKHIIEFYGEILQWLGLRPGQMAMKFPMDSADVQHVSEILESHASKAPVVTIVPGGGASWGRDASRKRWIPQNFAQVADRLAGSCGATVVLSGGHEDRKLGEIISGLMKNPVIDLTGVLTLGQSAALFSKSRVVVTNDGGPLHMSVAAGTPTVSIFGPVDERVYGPYPSAGHKVVCSNIACRPCYRRFRVAQCDHISCLKKLDTDQVFRAVEGFL